MRFLRYTPVVEAEEQACQSTAKIEPAFPGQSDGQAEQTQHSDLNRRQIQSEPTRVNERSLHAQVVMAGERQDDVARMAQQYGCLPQEECSHGE